MTTFNNLKRSILDTWNVNVIVCLVYLSLDKKIQNMQRKKRVILNAQNLQ